MPDEIGKLKKLKFIDLFSNKKMDVLPKSIGKLKQLENLNLGNNQIKTIDDLGDLASDELLEMLPDAGLSIEDANNIIMTARAHWFEDDEGSNTDVGQGNPNEE